MNQVGLKIRKYRESAGLSQEYVASKLGMTQSNYQRLEKNDERLDIVRLQKIADVLHIKLMELLMEDEQQASGTHAPVASQHNDNYLMYKAMVEIIEVVRFENSLLRAEIQQIKNMLNDHTLRFVKPRRKKQVPVVSE